MSRITTTITDSAGRVTSIVSTRSSGCSGCLVALAIVVALIAPLGFPGPLMVLAYAVDAIVFTAAIINWWNNRRGHGQAVPLPPPPPAR